MMNKTQLAICKIPIKYDNKNTKTNFILQINPDINKTIVNKTVNSHSKVKSMKANKLAHIVNGNIKTTILQVNSSNSDWITKQVELLNIINEHKSNITIASEANVEYEDTDKTTSRLSTFKDYRNYG